MFPESTILNYLFWMGMGVIQVLAVRGAYEWLRHYKKDVSWWQMLLMYGCFLSFCLTVAGGTTLMGEYETHGGLYFIGFLGVPHVIAMAILLKLFVFKKVKA
jgi:hypothetical protein